MDDLFWQIIFDIGFIALGVLFLLNAKRIESQPEKVITPNQKYSAKSSKGAGIGGVLFGTLLLLRHLILLFQ